MSLMMMTEAFKVKVGNPARKLVLVKLADNANDQGECWPSYGHIAKECEMGKSTVRAHIKALQDAGFLTIKNRRNGELNQSNLYQLTLSRGKPIQRSKPARPGKCKTKTFIDLSQPLAYISRWHRGVSAADIGVSAVDRGVYQPLTPESVNKNPPMNLSVEPICATALHEGFELFYDAGLPKKNRKKAETAFKTQAKKHGNPVAFAKMLTENIKGRLGTNELGFDAMHPSTYLNQQRWLDEVAVSAASDPSIPKCPHAEILAIWDKTCAKIKGAAPNLLDWMGTTSAEALAERWAEFYDVEVNGRVRYDSLESGLDWWEMALGKIASMQDFRNADIDIWRLFYKGAFSRAANGNLCNKGSATR